jgi:hypothetical protein
LEAFEENCFEDFDLQIFSTLPDLDFLDLDVMTDLCSETTGRVILALVPTLSFQCFAVLIQIP